MLNSVSDYMLSTQFSTRFCANANSLIDLVNRKYFFVSYGFFFLKYFILKFLGRLLKLITTFYRKEESHNFLLKFFAKVTFYTNLINNNF